MKPALCDACRSKTLVVITVWRRLRRHRVIRCLHCHVWIEEPRRLRWRIASLTAGRDNQIALGVISAALIIVLITVVSVTP